MSRTIEREKPCPQCGWASARLLRDGSVECIRCRHVTPDPFIAAKRSLGVSSR